MEKIRIFAILSILYLASPQAEVFCQSEQKDKKPELILLHPHKFYKKYFPHLKIKRDPPDSAYIKEYPNYFSVGMHVLSPAIGLNIFPRDKNLSVYDPASKFRTNISDILGFSASYRYVAFGFAFLLKSGMNTHEGYTDTKYRTATIKYASGPNILQFKYIRMRGFTDINQRVGTDPDPKYVLRPDMVSKELQFEGIRNFSWRKYSYIAPITYTQRQVKSRGGFLLKGGVYYNELSGDSSLVGKKQQMYFDDFRGVTAMRSLSIRLAPGIGGTLVVYRRIYLSAAAFTSYDFYLYKYLTNDNDKVKGKDAFIFFMDGKASLGYQSQRIYAGIRFETERRMGDLHNLNLAAAYSYTGIELGYRFDAPKIVKKVYKKTMPPGM